MKLLLSERGLVDLDMRRIVTTREELSALSEVRYLHASDNEITKVAGLQPLTSVQHINLCRNRLISLHGVPLTLVSLDVSHNSLTTIEPLAGLENLQNLDVSHNKLQSLEGLPRRAPLKIVKASYNLVSSLKALRHVNTTTLRSLSVDSNYIKDPSEWGWLVSLTNLVALTIAANPVCKLFPDYQREICEELPNLQSIDGLNAVALLKSAQLTDEEMQMRETHHHPPPQGDKNAAVLAAAVSDLVGRGAPSGGPAGGGPGGARGNFEHHRFRELLETSRRLPIPKTSAANSSKIQRSPDRVNHPIPPPALSEDQEKVRLLEFKLEEQTRILEETQSRALLLERDNQRKGEEIRNCNRMITEQRKTIAEVRDRQAKAEAGCVALKERNDKLAREFKYAHEQNTILKGRRPDDSQFLHDRDAIESAAALLSVPAPPSRRASTPSKKTNHDQQRSPTAPAGRNRRRSATPPQKGGRVGYGSMHANSLLAGDSGVVNSGVRSASDGSGLGSGGGGGGVELNMRLQHVLAKPRRSSTPPVKPHTMLGMAAHMAHPSPVDAPLFGESEIGSSTSRTMSRSSPPKQTDFRPQRIF